MHPNKRLVGYHASHEQFPPDELLGLVQRAEHAGFTAAMCSDHFHPWSDAQGQSGHAWTWLGAAMATTKLPFAVVNAPVGRYHPAIIAQAVATLCVMHAGRFTLIAGSGEALNEAITGRRWPAKAERNRRLRAAVEAMRVLWRGEEIKQTPPDVGFRIEQARLYTRPNAMPKVFAGCDFGAAFGSMPASRHQAFLNNGPYQTPPSMKADTAATRIANQFRSCMCEPSPAHSEPTG